jgi:hypothetical protein
VKAVPQVSVVLPTRNRARLLPQAIDSVLSQTVRDIELLVVDDGSTDDTAAVLEGYGDPVRVLRTDPGGVSRARNLGLDRVHGEHVAFIDSDDLWDSRKLEFQLDLLRRHPDAAAVCCDMVELDGAAERPESFFQRIGFTGDLTPRAMFFHNPIATPTLVAERQVLERAGRFDPDLTGAEDYEYFFRLLRFGAVRPLFRTLVTRRLQPRALSRDRLRMAQGTIVAVERGVEWFPEVAADLGPALRHRFAQLDLDLAYARLLEGDHRTARVDLVRSLRRRPSGGRAWMFLAATLLGPAGFRTLRRWRRSAGDGTAESRGAGP